MEKECEVRCKDEKSNSWLKEWLKTFWYKHGERLVFLALANLFAIGLDFAGLKSGNDVLLGTGIGIHAGSAQLLFNKVRGAENNGKIPTE